MIAMEFEEMQKIWDDQRGETMYAIDEDALHRRIKSKKRAESRRISIVEICLMIINSTVAISLLVDAIVDKEGIWDYAMSIVMMLTVVFLIVFRIRRKRKENTFDRTMLGELDHAISNANSIVRIATIMVLYYLIPVGGFSLVKMAVFGASIEKWMIVLGAYLLAFLLITWEKKHYHIPRKEHLERLREKLLEE